MIFTTFSVEIWLMLISVSSLFIIIFGMADYIFYGKVKWSHLAGFTTRTAMIEAVMKPLHDDAKSYQKLFVVSWTIPMFILATAYAGNMTARLAKPTLEILVKDAEDLVNQNQILWTLNYGTLVVPAFKNSAPGTVFRKLYDKAEAITHHDCYSARNEPFWKTRQYAMPCSGISVLSLMSFDYSKTGSCNYYKTSDIFAKVNFALAFQVTNACKFYSLHMYTQTHQFVHFQKESPHIDDFNKLIGIGLQMGIFDIRNALPNSTKCDTWAKAEASHTSAKLVQLKLQDIYGHLLLLCGLAIGTIIFFIEMVPICFKHVSKGARRITHRQAWTDQ